MSRQIADYFKTYSTFISFNFLYDLLERASLNPDIKPIFFIINI